MAPTVPQRGGGGRRADDIVLISSTVHSQQMILDVCSSFALEVDMRFNSSKSVVMRDKPQSFVCEAKYLGVCLLSASNFKVSVHHMKCNFLHF